MRPRRKSASILLRSTLVSGDRGHTLLWWGDVQFRFKAKLGRHPMEQRLTTLSLYRPDIYWLSRAFFRPSQKIESVFAASPETIREKPPEIDSPLLSRLKARPGSLRAGESCFFLVVVAALRSGAALFPGRHKGPLLAIDRE
jgi:hypothetical protein